MAKLPTPGNFQAPRTDRPIVSDRSGQIIAGAVSSIGQTVGAVAAEKREAEDRFTYARASSIFQQADIAARRKLENDPDFETYETRYREEMAKGVEAATGVIRSPMDRQLFQMQSELSIERGVGDVRTAARGREVDWGRAELTQQLEGNREAALNARDEPTRTAIINSSLALIAGAKEHDYIDDVQAGEIRRRWTQDYAEGFLVVQSPQTRIDLLKSPEGTPAQFLSTDRRAALLEAAEKENEALRIRSESQSSADTIMQAHESRADALKAAREINDADVRDSVVSRINQRFNELDVVEREENDKLFTNASTIVEESGSTDGIHRAEWLKLTINQRQALEQRAMQLSGGGKVETNYEVYYNLMDMAATDKAGFADLNLMQFRPALDDSNFEAMTKAQMEIREGKTSVLVTGYRTTQQIVDSTLNELGIKYGTSAGTEQNARANEFRRQVEQAIDDMREATGRTVTTQDVQEIVDDLAITGQVPGGWFGGKDSLLFESADIPEFEVTSIDAIPARHQTAIRDAILNNGGDPTNADVLYWFNEMVRSR